MQEERPSRTANEIKKLGGGDIKMTFTYLYLRGFGAAEPFIDFNPELEADRSTVPIEDGPSWCGVQAAIFLTVHVHGRKSHNVLLQRRWRGIHFMKVRRTWGKFQSVTAFCHQPTPKMLGWHYREVSLDFCDMILALSKTLTVPLL